MTAVRSSLLRSIRERVNALPELVDALDLETDPGAAQVEAERLTQENERLKAWLCICPQVPPEYFDPDAECLVHGDPKLPRLSLRGALKWRGAFEALHARILRDLPGDGSELAPPDDAFWAAQLDGLARYAGELYQQTESGEVPDA